MKYLLTIAAIILTFSVSNAQTPYYIFPSDSSATAISLSQQSGIANPSPRCALAGTPCILKVNPGLAPAWMSGPYTASYLRDSLLTNPLWNADAGTVDSISAEDQIARARSFGNQLTLTFTTRINQEYQDGSWTIGQAANVYVNYQEMLFMIKDGQLQLVSDLIGGGQIAPLGVITQGNLDAVKAKLDAWLTDNPLQN